MSDVKSLDEPGPSIEREKAFEQNLCEDNKKLNLKNAIIYYEQLLAQDGLITEESSSTITEESILLAEDLYHHTLQNLLEKKFITDDELIMSDEIDVDNAFEEVKVEEDESDYEPKEKQSKKQDFVPINYKIKVINIAKSHPKWSLKNLHKKGCYQLKRMDQLPIWEQHIKSGGTIFDKYTIIDSWTYDRFIEARQINQQVTTRNLQQWALAAASQFEDFDFKASNSWVEKFKRKHRIRQRKITRYVSEKESATIEETLASAENFRIQARHLILNFNPNFVINTDQTGIFKNSIIFHIFYIVYKIFIKYDMFHKYFLGCQYQSTFNRTLAEQGSKQVFVQRQNINKTTHSYTAQYSITLDGKLLPLVFVCLQEPTGIFGPRVQKLVDEYVGKYNNVVVTSSKSGKLTTNLYKHFLTTIIKSYVKQEKFLLLVDSWGGQTKPEIYDEIFLNDEHLPTCTVKFIPPKCTPLVQPCDVYFYRQVKNFIKKLQNCAYLIEQKREINSREDCIKIHSIVHHQLSSPIFSNMIQYAWFASKLCDNREIFMNVNEVCFSMENLKKPCNCNKSAFIQCATCRETYCFICFYDKYHSGSCNTDE
ncbi:uncharacterized protein LOC118644689 [Monomorium pharaonis]|uniref:uncharacterized protein LOC118644689 n=1 Tax=Monomorium pharaonis TaxID=307658 RepID=UPI00174774AF|nr:uncharacterized protein LOC118644689 [Monomorium pharaonis]